MSTVALITGANKGIGLETARQLGQQGVTVLIAARDPAKGNTAAAALVKEGIAARFVQLDVTDPRSVSAAAAAIARDFGHLDILINNAGANLEPWDQAPSKTTPQELRDTFDVNFFSVVAVTQAMLPLLHKSTAGRIVNVSSVLGSIGEHQNPAAGVYGMMCPAYSASKAALNMFTANLAFELKDTPIKVNIAHPGWVKTDMGGPNAPLSVEEGAKTSVWLATLPADGPTGGFFHMQKTLPW